MKPRYAPKTILIFLAVLALNPMAGSTISEAATLEQTLTASGIWGKNFPAFLKSMNAWKGIGTGRVMLFRDRAVAVTPFDDPQTAEAALNQFANKMTLTLPSATGPYRKLLATATSELGAKTDVVQLGEDGFFHVSWVVQQGGGLIRDGLSIEQVRDILGAEEKVTTEVINTRGEMRPVVLTLFHYADDAVLFAESDMSSDPSIIDRVIFNTTAIATEVFGADQ